MVEITAHEARTKTIEAVIERDIELIEKQLKVIMEMISRASADGDYEIKVDFNMHGIVYERLEILGYDIRSSFTEDVYVVNWESVDNFDFNR